MGSKGKTLKMPRLYRKQHEAFYPPDKPEAGLILIEGSVKSGKTFGLIHWWLREVERWQRPGRIFTWAAPVYSQTRIAYRRVKLGLEDTGLLQSANDTAQTLHLKHSGAILEFRSTENESNLRGSECWALAVDEASYVKQDAWISLRSTVSHTRTVKDATGRSAGRIVAIGNVFGSRNWFYQLSRQAESGNEKGMSYSKLTALDAVKGGILSEEELEESKKTMPLEDWEQMYLGIPRGDTGSVFGDSYIANAIEPLSSEPVSAWGLDIARTTDWTVLTGLSKTGRVVYWDRWQRVSWEETQRRVVAAVSAHDAPISVDSTGVGDIFHEQLARSPVGRLVHEYKFTSLSKTDLVQDLIIGVQGGHVKFPPGIIEDEMRNFGYALGRKSIQFEAATGHDDAVISLALAWHCLNRYGKRAEDSWGIW